MSQAAKTALEMTALSNNPFDVARRRLVDALSRMPVPRPIGSYPVPGDFEAVRDHLREAAALMDAWLADIGHQVSGNASVPLDMRVFDAAFSGAIEGEATWVCEIAAQGARGTRRVA